MILDRKKKYLQIALNSGLNDAASIIGSLPDSDRIILEAGTPLIKRYGIEAVSRLAGFWRMRGFSHPPYVVADLKTMDRGETEVKMAAEAGASAAVCLGQAAVETIDSFIASCRASGLDSMIDMMNIDFPVKTLRLLKKQPDVVILHRGVDEEQFNPDKPIPYIQINKILSSYSVMISLAGGDSIREVQRAVFNGASIVVVWKEFYRPTGHTGTLAAEFLRQIK